VIWDISGKFAERDRVWAARSLTEAWGSVDVSGRRGFDPLLLEGESTEFPEEEDLNRESP